METWNDIILALIQMFGVVLAAIAPMLALLAYRALARKMKIETDAHVEGQLAAIARDAVAFAEQRATSAVKADPLRVAPGHEKMAQAVAFAINEVKRRKLPEVAQAALVNLIEAKVGEVNRESRAPGPPVVLEPPPGPTP